MTAALTTAVRCPACNGGRYLPRSRDFVASDRIEPCSLCRGAGTLDPDEWYSENDPARLVAMLGSNVDENRLVIFGEICEQKWFKAIGVNERPNPRMLADWWNGAMPGVRRQRRSARL